MKFLLFVSLVLPFRGLTQGTQPSANSTACFRSAIPKFTSDLYAASVNVVGHHISGLLFLKTMPDSSQRAVFSNETGITYFDFEWSNDGKFKTYHVIKKLKKKIVLNTLRKDFELIVVPASLRNSVKLETDTVYSTSRSRENLKFRTDGQCYCIREIDVFGKKSKLVEGKFFPSGKNIPDSISIVHHNFSMKISLKKIAH